MAGRRRHGVGPPPDAFGTIVRNDFGAKEDCMERRAISVGGATLRDCIAAAKAAEDAGFDVVWFNDNTGVDGLIGLAAMAMATRKVTLASGIARAFVRAPTVTAVAATDLDELTEGRFILGLAGGTPKQNLYESSVVVEHPVPQMRELNDILQLMWARSTPGPVVYNGKFYTINLRNYRRKTTYQQRIPIYIAALREKMLELTGELFDGLAGHPINSIWFIENFIWPRIDAGLARSGRTRADFTMSSWILTAISNDRAMARREAAAQIAFYLTTRSYSHLADMQGWQKQRLEIQDAFHNRKDMTAMVDAVTDDMIDAMSIAGTPDEVRKKAEAYVDVLHLPTFQAPGILMSPDRRVEAQNLILEVFGRH
ncbi:MAG: LLM class flavin-dependent oxidoreductase [Dehalococcoidia bacterium]|nr:LLM class flavin-dependent oxidoreductase [Dehalococcoidia bacterium]